MATRLLDYQITENFTLLNTALLLKLSEFDTLYDLIKGPRNLSPIDQENIKRACMY